MQTKFIVIDPRPASKEEMISQIEALKAEGFYCLGLEMTIAHFAQLMNKNIDPQHTGGNPNKACITEVYELGLEDRIFFEDRNIPQNIALFTVRADLDSIGSMGLILWYLQCDLSTTLEHEVPGWRLEQIAQADCYTQEAAWSPRELFSGGYDQTDLAAIARAVSDFTIPVSTRVQWAADWLYNGEEPEVYRKAYNKEREQTSEALATGETTVRVDGNIAVVFSKLRSAREIGYQKAPVVVAFNPEMPSKAGFYKKFTICQFSSGYCDISAALKELSEMEPGWGGSPNIGGSPQEVSSELSMETVVGIVKKHLM